MNAKAKESENSHICDFSILRELRKANNLSIAELAQKSEVSTSVISKLERNCCRAEMETLFKIAKSFGLTLGDLISLAENRTSHSTSEESYQSGDFLIKKIAYGNVRCLHAFAKKGGKLSTPDIHKDDYELCWVRKGVIIIRLNNNEVHTLHYGMSIQFDALLNHTYEVLEDTELFITHIKKGKRF